MFRPRSKSDAKKKEKELAKASSTDKDSGSGGSSHSGSGGGIMHSMKAAMQHTMGQKSHDGKVKTKDGSAHPHAGSDAQVINSAGQHFRFAKLAYLSAGANQIFILPPASYRF